MRTREELEALGLTEDEITQELENQEEDREDAKVADTSVDQALAEAGIGNAGDATPPAAPATTPAAPPAATETAAEAPIAPAAPPAQTQPVTPPAPSNAARLTDLNTQIDALTTQFDEAGLTAAEYRAAMKPLEAEVRALETEDLKAAIREEAAQEMLLKSWGSTVKTFLTSHPEYAPGSLLFSTLDTAVIRAQEEARAKGLDANTPAIMESAHAAVLAAFGRPAAPAAESKPAAPAAQTPARRPLDVPPTLGGLPAAQTENVDTSEFGGLDRLAGNPDDPEALERALARMTPEQRDRYLKEA